MIATSTTATEGKTMYDSTFAAAQQRYDSRQPDESVSITFGTHNIRADLLGDYPVSMRITFTVSDSSDETGNAWSVTSTAAEVDGIDIYDMLHDGAIEQIDDELREYIKENGI